jgi:flagellar motor switch protein FliN/FliY
MGEFLQGKFVRIAFRMQIGDLVDSTILQLYPVDFAKELVATFLGGGIEEPAEEPVVTAYEPPKVEAPQSAPIADIPPMPTENVNPMMGITDMGMQGMNPMMGMPMQSSVSYQPAQFETFSNNVGTVPSNENISLIMDVPLEVTVELGRTSKSISEILDFTPGTIIELDKIAGEPIDVLVNGKFVAKGEVVVIEESFGIRVTEIIK